MMSSKYTLPVFALVVAGAIGGGTYMYAVDGGKDNGMNAASSMVMMHEGNDIFSDENLSFQEKKKLTLEDLDSQIEMFAKMKDEIQKAKTEDELRKAHFGVVDFEVMRDGDLSFLNGTSSVSISTDYDGLDEKVKKAISEEDWKSLTMRQIDDKLVALGIDKIFEDPFYDKTFSDINNLTEDELAEIFIEKDNSFMVEMDHGIPDFLLKDIVSE